MRVNAYLTVTSALFGLTALAHILRLVYAWPVTVGTWQAPIAFSWSGAAIAGCLCIWAIVLLRRRT